jgi:putative ABC transport system ATP-binding protein
MIEAQNVTKDYRLGATIVRALRGISLRIDSGEFVIIIGPSGSGKSTLLHILGALDHPTSGKVFVDGQDISQFDEWSLAMLRRKKMGFVFQTFNLIPTLTALENVVIPTEPMRLEYEEVLKKGIALLKELGIQKRANHKPNELSGGERQRVSIARALINDPEIIYADEPTGNLDSVTSEKIVSLMRGLNKKEGKTFVIVTHDESLLKYATKKFFLRDGMIERIEG